MLIAFVAVTSLAAGLVMVAADVHDILNDLGLMTPVALVTPFPQESFKQRGNKPKGTGLRSKLPNPFKRTRAT